MRQEGVWLFSGLALLGCAAPMVETSHPAAERRMAAAPRKEPRRHARVGLHSPQVELVYRGEAVFAKGNGEEWSLGDVRKSEMVFSPDQKRFVYVRERSANEPARVFIRNMAGDPVNEFPAYRAGKLSELTWLDDRRVGYIAQAASAQSDATSSLFVVHDALTGEVLAARSGGEFTWGPDRHHLVFVSGGGSRQVVVVDGRTVWPRSGVTRVHGTPAWSPDGHGLAFTEESPGGARLVVLVEFDDAQGDLTWHIPKDALGPGLKVFWAGDSKVVIGDHPLHPRFAADWKRLQ